MAPPPAEARPGLPPTRSGVTPRGASAAAATGAPILYVRFAPTWEHIEPLRQYVEVAAKRHGLAHSLERIGIVLQELLENAVKYGDPLAEVELTVHKAGAAGGLELQVSNRAHPARVALLEKEFQRVNVDTAQEAFSRALERLQRLPQGSSMLGLSRLAMEATLSLSVDDGRVTVRATIR